MEDPWIPEEMKCHLKMAAIRCHLRTVVMTAMVAKSLRPRWKMETTLRTPDPLRPQWRMEMMPKIPDRQGTTIILREAMMGCHQAVEGAITRVATMRDH